MWPKAQRIVELIQDPPEIFESGKEQTIVLQKKGKIKLEMKNYLKKCFLI